MVRPVLGLSGNGAGSLTCRVTARITGRYLYLNRRKQNNQAGDWQVKWSSRCRQKTHGIRHEQIWEPCACSSSSSSSITGTRRGTLQEHESLRPYTASSMPTVSSSDAVDGNDRRRTFHVRDQRFPHMTAKTFKIGISYVCQDLKEFINPK